MKLLPQKDPTEIVPVTFDFAPDIASGATVTPVSVTVTVINGSDSNPGDVLQGAASAVGAKVVQWIKAGQAGVSYAIRCVATATDGQTLVLTSRLDVVAA